MASEPNPPRRVRLGANGNGGASPRTRQLARLPQRALASIADEQFAHFTARSHSYKLRYELRLHRAWLQREVEHRDPRCGLLRSARYLWAVPKLNQLRKQIRSAVHEQDLADVHQEDLPERDQPEGNPQKVNDHARMYQMWARWSAEAEEEHLVQTWEKKAKSWTKKLTVS